MCGHADVVHGLARRGHLRRASVDDDELRRVRESRRLALLGRQLRPPRGSAQSACVSTSFMAAVSSTASPIENCRYSFLRGKRVLEHHHRAHLVGALGVRDVVALDPQRRLVQAEVVLEVAQAPRSAS